MPIERPTPMAQPRARPAQRQGASPALPAPIEAPRLETRLSSFALTGIESHPEKAQELAKYLTSALYLMGLSPGSAQVRTDADGIHFSLPTGDRFLALGGMLKSGGRATLDKLPDGSLALTVQFGDRLFTGKDGVLQETDRPNVDGIVASPDRKRFLGLTSITTDIAGRSVAGEYRPGRLRPEPVADVRSTQVLVIQDDSGFKPATHRLVEGGGASLGQLLRSLPSLQPYARTVYGEGVVDAALTRAEPGRPFRLDVADAAREYRAATHGRSFVQDLNDFMRTVDDRRVVPDMAQLSGAVERLFKLPPGGIRWADTDPVTGGSLQQPGDLFTFVYTHAEKTTVFCVSFATGQAFAGLAEEPGRPLHQIRLSDIPSIATRELVPGAK